MNKHLRHIPHRLFILMSVIFFISLLTPLKGHASTLEMSEASFDEAHKLVGSTAPYSKVFIYETGALPIKMIKSNASGKFIVNYPFKDNTDYFVVIKYGNSFHYFSVMYNQQAVSEGLEIGGGFLSGKNDSYNE